MTRDQLDDIRLTVIFEGETCRRWVEELSKRIRTAELRARDNAVIKRECRDELAELVEARKALERAVQALRPLMKLAARAEVD